MYSKVEPGNRKTTARQGYFWIFLLLIVANEQELYRKKKKYT
jgi:hypothetical protein